MTNEDEWENEGGAVPPNCDLCGEPNATYVSQVDGAPLCMEADACMERYFEKLNIE